MVQNFTLVPHFDHPPIAVSSISARLALQEPHWLTLRWRIEGAGRLTVPPFAGRRRMDGLWQATCFELFIGSEEGFAYHEWNFSPSEAWAAYCFDNYRAGMARLEISGRPVITWRGGASGLRLMDVAIPRADLPPLPWRYSMTAVLEEEGGHRSFWAAAHPAGKPDFHNAACFTGSLAAPPRP